MKKIHSAAAHLAHKITKKRARNNLGIGAGHPLAGMGGGYPFPEVEDEALGAAEAPGESEGGPT